MLSVRLIMTPNPTTIGPEAKIWEAANTMVDQHISGLPVIGEDGRLLGIISESDFLRRGEIHSDARHSRWRTLFSSRGALAEDYAKAFGKDVGEVMSSPAVTVEPETTVEAAAEIMGGRNIKRLPVVEDGKVVGIVTRSDGAPFRPETHHRPDPVALSGAGFGMAFGAAPGRYEVASGIATARSRLGHPSQSRLGRERRAGGARRRAGGTRGLTAISARRLRLLRFVKALPVRP